MEAGRPAFAGGDESVGKAVEVLVCTPVYREGSYVIDGFLANQREIQRSRVCSL